MKKTNAMRILDGLKIKYETLSYEDDGEHELSRGAAENIAAKLGINPAACFKTIVMRNESKQIFVFCQSAIHEINLKKSPQRIRLKRNQSGKTRRASRFDRLHSRWLLTSWHEKKVSDLYRPDCP